MPFRFAADDPEAIELRGETIIGRWPPSPPRTPAVTVRVAYNDGSEWPVHRGRRPGGYCVRYPSRASAGQRATGASRAAATGTGRAGAARPRPRARRSPTRPPPLPPPPPQPPTRRLTATAGTAGRTVNGRGATVRWRRPPTARSSKRRRWSSSRNSWTTRPRFSTPGRSRWKTCAGRPSSPDKRSASCTADSNRSVAISFSLLFYFILFFWVIRFYYYHYKSPLRKSN